MSIRDRLYRRRKNKYMSDKIKLLIADDEVKFLDPLAKRLELRGFEVTKASNGRQALEYADQERFDLALVDLKMPEVDGKVVLQQLKAHGDSPVVIIMTGHGSGELAEECLQMGAFSYIPKPYELDRMIELFQKAYAAHLKKRYIADPVLIERLSSLEKATDPLVALFDMRKLVK